MTEVLERLIPENGGYKIFAPVQGLEETVLSPAALSFVTALERRFGADRRRVMQERAYRQRRFDVGELPHFYDETRSIRADDWKVDPAPADLRDRRVEITGPTDRKMMINAFNSGANVFMADCEDSLSPTWDNQTMGQANLYDHARGTLEYTDPTTGKEYQLAKNTAVLMVRPRGLHMEEAHMHVDGRAVSAALFDFGMHAFHNAQALIDAGSGPYFYLPKLEIFREAEWWSDVIAFTEEALGLERGVIKVTVLIETLPAAFCMDEILYYLRENIVGLNCGRWDYIFSYIKRLRDRPRYLLPDRAQVGMGDAFLKAYSLLLIQTCHRRGAHAMGGMAAQIPVKGDDAESIAANEAAFAKVRADKEREAKNGHDGTWVAHPGMVAIAKEVFDELMPGENQIEDKKLEDLKITRDDLLEVHEGTRTEDGLRENVRVGIQYIEAWLMGRGAVPLYNLMEDAATAEISRAQVWQWITHSAALEDGRKVTAQLVDDIITDEMATLKTALGKKRFDGGRFGEAIDIFRDTATNPVFREFLTIPAYERIIESPRAHAAE